MARPFSGKKSQQDENALKQWENSSNLRFWNRELRARKLFAYGDFEKSMIVRDIFLFTIFYHHNKIDEPLETFLSKVHKQQNLEMSHECHTEYFTISYQINENIYKYLDIIRSVIDATLNIDKSTLAYSLNFYLEPAPFYMDNIRDYLITIRDVCLTYGLYPHQFDARNSCDLIFKLNNEGEKIFEEHDILFVVKHNPEPPVKFNHIVNEQNLFEKESPSKFYYYFSIKECGSSYEILECIKNKFSSYLDGNMNSKSNYDECNNKNVQVAIDVSNNDYNFKKCINHIEKELEKCFSYYYNPIQPLSYLKQIAVNNELMIPSNLNVNEKKDFFDMLRTQIAAERQAVETYNITSGGHCSKINNITRLCGMYIWDLEHYYKISHKLTEAFLAEDTKLKDEAKEALFALTLNGYDDPRDDIEDVRTILAGLGCTMTRKMLHQNYSNFCTLVENCTKHPLW